ncbi:PREDICTED: renin receptor [Ceratosolen solmsi marchali]|uniref:Renin receptor n=1 Tax=Ceratosolen solmsi marchali TaxID=326594 RepID=A0AAJ7E0G0_9HYME|nr:PREDICTED: renin receptor [Ceratosolen solmsi marchali]
MFSQICWIFVSFIIYVQASGEFVLLHTPDSVIFKGNKEIDQSLLKEVFSASLGFTVKQRATWTGMSITNPFNLPEAIVAIAVEGIESLGLIKGKKFPLHVDEVEETTWQALSGRLEERDNDNTLVRIYLGDGLDALGHSALGELKPTTIDESSLKALSLKKDEDRKFLEEVQLLHAIAKKVTSAIRTDNKPDVYWLVVSGLHPVFDTHGKNSVAAKEALILLNEALRDVSKAFIDVYKSQVLIAAFTNDASQVRHTRSINLREQRDAADDKTNKLETTTIKIESSSSSPNGVLDEEYMAKIIEKNDKEHEKIQEKYIEDEIKDKISDISDKVNESTHEPDLKEYFDDFTYYYKKSLELKDLNIANVYSEDYPVIFNIILWFGVVFFFSLLAICFTIAEMDPGRDSIIYRMTSNRMKKDN